jgi:hypothetical protein
LAQRGQLDWSDPSTSTGQYDPIEYGGILVNYAVFIGRPNILFLVYQCVCEGGVGKDRVTSRNPITNASLRVELPRVARELDQDELIDRWTLVGDELNLVPASVGRRSSASPCCCASTLKEAGSLGEGAKSRTTQSITWLVR